MGSQLRDAWLVHCGHLAGVSLAVDCNGWQQFVHDWSAGGASDVVLVVIPA